MEKMDGYKMKNQVILAETILCSSCKNFNKEDVLEKVSCKAFSLIPEDILKGNFKHDKPFPGQGNNIIFEEGEK